MKQGRVVGLAVRPGDRWMLDHRFECPLLSMSSVLDHLVCERSRDTPGGIAQRTPNTPVYFLKATRLRVVRLLSFRPPLSHRGVWLLRRSCMAGCGCECLSVVCCVWPSCCVLLAK
ncbi:unnamed protein product [Hapterophycus canaliculatus]